MSKRAKTFVGDCRTPATEPSDITPGSTHKSLKPASWKRLPIIDSRVQAVWNTPILSTISWSKTRRMLLNLRVFLNLSDCTRTSWKVAMSVADASIVGRYPMTSCEIWTLLRTELLNPVQPLAFCFFFAWSRPRIQRKFFFLASAKISSAATSTNVLARGPQRSPVLYGGTNKITQGSMLLFLVLACSIPGAGGRFGSKCLAWTAMPFTRWDVPVPERISTNLSMLSHASVVLTYAWIFSGKGTSLSGVKVIFYKQSAVFISPIWEYAIPCPHRFNIWISSALSVKVFFLRTVAVFALGVSVFLQLPRMKVTPYMMSCPKELTRRRTRWGYSVVISVFRKIFGENKKLIIV